MLTRLVRHAVPLVALVVLFGAGVSAPVVGQDASASSAAAPASSAAAPAAAAGDADVLAAGKHVWTEAACFNCHGANGQGGQSFDFPKGPNLRTSGLDPDTLLQIVECGLPGTRMPAWLKGAYTEVACYGNPVGPAPDGTTVSGAFSDQDLKNLVAYIEVNFMKQPMPTWTAQ